MVSIIHSRGTRRQTYYKFTMGATRMYTSSNCRKQKLQSLNIKVNRASKQRLTLKQVYLITKIRNLILPADYLSVFVFVYYVDLNITSITIIIQKEFAIRLRGSFSSMRCEYTSLTQKPRGDH